MYGFSKLNEQISQHSRCEFVRDLCAGSLPIFPSDANAWIYIYGQSCCSIYDWQWRHTEHCWGNERGRNVKKHKCIQINFYLPLLSVSKLEIISAKKRIFSEDFFGKEYSVVCTL